MKKSAFKAAIILSAVDKMSKTVNAAFKNADLRMQRTQKRANEIASASANFATKSGAAGIALGAPLVYATNKAIQFEEAMAGVGKVMDMANGSKELGEIGKKVQGLAIYLARDQEMVAELYANIAQGGIAKAEIMEVAKAAGEMGVAFDMEAGLAADRFIKVKNALGATTEKTKKLADTINYLSNKEAAKASQIVDFFSAGGAAATNAMKVAPQVSAAFGTMFISAGKSGEEAATIFERFSKSLLMGKGQAGKFFQAKGGGLEGLLAVIEKAKSLKSATDRLQFFKGAGEYALEISQLANNYDGFQRVLKEANDTQGQANSVNLEFQNRMSTTATKMLQAKARFEAVSTSLGGHMLPIVTALLEKVNAAVGRFTAWADKNPRLAKGIMMATGAIAALMVAASGIGFLISGIAGGISGATTIMQVFGKVLPFVATGFRAITAALISNPIIAVIAGIAAGAYLIYKNWEPIKAFFSNLWDHVSNAFAKADEWIRGFTKNWYEAGANIISAIWQGMKSLAMKPVEVMKGIVEKIRDFLPFSPAKAGPLKDIHKVRIVETIADTMKPRPMVNAMKKTMQLSTQPIYQGGGNQGSGISVNYSPTINFSGAFDETTKIDFYKMLGQHKQDILRLIDQAVADKQRRAF